MIGATRFNDNESEVIHNKNNNIGFAAYTRHFDENYNLARAIMLKYEAILAANSNSQMVMLDGSISSTLLSTNLAARVRFSNQLTEEFAKDIYDYIVTLASLLSGKAENPLLYRMYVFCPKSTEKQEICYKMEWDKAHAELLSSINEKELMNQILQAGEYTTAQQLTSRDKVYDDNYSTLHNWHIFTISLKGKDPRIVDCYKFTMMLKVLNGSGDHLIAYR